MKAIWLSICCLPNEKVIGTVKRMYVCMCAYKSQSYREELFIMFSVILLICFHMLYTIARKVKWNMETCTGACL